jgi:hypothetical protein
MYGLSIASTVAVSKKKKNYGNCCQSQTQDESKKKFTPLKTKDCFVFSLEN